MLAGDPLRPLLVHFEEFGNIRDAIAREKKVWLIERNDPTWEDLANRLASKRKREKQIPHPRPRRAGPGSG